MKDKDLVLVDWRDAFGVQMDWRCIDHIKPDNLLCHSVGWLTHKDKDSIVITPHISDQNHDEAEFMGCGDMTIPMLAVIKITKLRKK